MGHNPFEMPCNQGKAHGLIYRKLTMCHSLYDSVALFCYPLFVAPCQLCLTFIGFDKGILGLPEKSCNIFINVIKILCKQSPVKWFFETFGDFVEIFRLISEFWGRGR